MSKELAIIDLISRLTGQTAALADDAFWDPETRQIITTDMLVEGHHFSQQYFSPADIGWKAAAVNISDIAAMGGQLASLFVSLGLPEATDMQWVEQFYTGMLQVCQPFHGVIQGGDTVSSEHLVINVTAIGHCPAGTAPGFRGNAATGDFVVTTGFHGLSHVGLQVLQSGSPNYEQCKATHLRPMPRIEAGQYLARRFSRYALMDSSDGLADALLKIAQTSQKRLIVNQPDIPVHPEVAAYYQSQAPVLETAIEKALWKGILYGGEDFELVATVPEVDRELLQYFSVIGRVEAPEPQAGAWMSSPSTQTLQALSLHETYNHFSRAEENPRQGGLNA